MATDQFSLQWDNFHKNMSAGMQSLLESEDLVDVTLAVEGRHLKAHKMVLSLCSPYFRELFQTNPCKHPIVFMKDVSYIALSDLLQFMYQGEVQVAQENLSTFIKTAEALQIKGLTGDSNNQLEDPLETFEVEKQKATVQYVKRTHEVANVETTPSAPRVKKTAAPIPKRARYSRSSTTNVISNAPVEEPIEAIESHDTATTSALEHIIQMKSEPGDIGTESIQVKGADESEVQDFMEDTLGDDDTEDYSLMEHTEDDPKPGTSSDGVGDGQDWQLKSDTSQFSIAEDDTKAFLKKKRASTRSRFVFNGFVYHNKLIAGKPPTRYLACAEMKRTGCRARAILPVNGTEDQLRVTAPHNHPCDVYAEEKDYFYNHLKSAARTMPGSLKQVYENIAILYPNGAQELPFRNVCSSLHRWRKSFRE